MKVCLYCQHPNPDEKGQCAHCAMHLPASDVSLQALRLRRFQWFCLGLTLFCVVMFFWLPRGIY